MTYFRQSVNKALNMTQKYFMCIRFPYYIRITKDKKSTQKFDEHNELFQIVLKIQTEMFTGKASSQQNPTTNRNQTKSLSLLHLNLPMFFHTKGSNATHHREQHLLLILYHIITKSNLQEESCLKRTEQRRQWGLWLCDDM